MLIFGDFTLTLEFLPPFVAFFENLRDRFKPVAVGFDFSSGKLVVGGTCHFLKQLLLLGLKRVDFLRQRLEFTLFLIGELHTLRAGGLRLSRLFSLRCRGWRGLRTAVLYPVGIAADILMPLTVPFRCQHLCHSVIEEPSVMRHEDQRAGIVLQNLFEEFERIDIEIVRRLVKHKEVGGSRFRSPPESASTGESARWGEKRKSFR